MSSSVASVKKSSCNLPDYTLAGVTMEFMGAHQEKYINGIDTAETRYWLKLGRDGLRAAIGQGGLVY